MRKEMDKTERVLSIYSKLLNGHILYKSQIAQEYGVNERTIHRDIEAIRQYMANQTVNTGCIKTLIYDRTVDGYRFKESNDHGFSNGEVLAISKILLESRAFTKKRMEGILQRLLACCVPKEKRKNISDLLKNETYHYIELQHHSDDINKLWNIGKAIREHNYISISYQRIKDKQIIQRKIKPVSIMFSEFYFYVIAFIEGKSQENLDFLKDSYPTIYRLDRIKEYELLSEKFRVPYVNRFEEGEFRKRVQFMFGGKLRRVTFTYMGESIEAVLDRLPTAQIKSEKDGVYIVTAEVFGKGIEMWLKSQGEMIKNLEIR